MAVVHCLVGLIAACAALLTSAPPPKPLRAAVTQSTHPIQTRIRPVHRVVRLPEAAARDPAIASSPGQSWLSEAVAAPFAFTEIAPSWNIRAPEHHGYGVALRLGRGMPVEWSPWFELGPMEPAPDSEDSRARRSAFGKLETDYIICKLPCTHVQARVTFAGKSRDSTRSTVDRFLVCISNFANDKRLAATRAPKPRRADAAAFTRRLPVPFISQHVRIEQMKGNICSPTSVAMVLGYHGVKVSAEDAATAAFDPRAKIYGNWPLNVQAAFERGIPGFVTRFADWDEVERSIAAGLPIIASIRDPDGQLKGTPYGRTTGHLLVICGFDQAGNVLVNDPAGRDARHGQLTYDRHQFEQAWLAQGGFAYILNSTEYLR